MDRSLRLDAGWVSSAAPPQALFLLGGRGTLPGFAYREAVGDRFLLLRGWVRRPVAWPWVSLRATGAAGWSRLDPAALPATWSGEVDPGIRGSLGLGLDLLWDVLQIDAARGVTGGDWTVYFSVTGRFQPWL